MVLPRCSAAGAGQQLDSAAAAFVDLRAGVPAPQAADGDAEPGQRAVRAADGQGAVTRMPPAQLTVRTPSSSESR